MDPAAVRSPAVAAFSSKMGARKSGATVRFGSPGREEDGRTALRDVGDEVLVDRVAGGDERALSELYARYSRPVYATGFRLLRDASLAEELVQDAFTNVWRGAGTFDPKRASFATWLYRITHNRATDLTRKRSVRPVSVGEDPLRTIPDESQPEASVDSWDVARALSRIPGEHREVLTLAYFQGLTHHEISQRTGVPLGTIKSRITAALKRLRKAINHRSAEETRHD